MCFSRRRCPTSCAGRRQSEERARPAELEGERAAVQAREQRKRRWVQLALLATVAALLVSTLTAAAWLYQRERPSNGGHRPRGRGRTPRRQKLNERGWKESGEPELWKRTLREAMQELDRAENRLATGPGLPSDFD